MSMAEDWFWSLVETLVIAAQAAAIAALLSLLCIAGAWCEPTPDDEHAMPAFVREGAPR